MPLDETFGNLAAFLNSLDAEGEQKFELSHSLVIICPDCGKNIAFRGRCPKCAGNSWIPAGNAGGIFERMKAQRMRRMIADEDVERSRAGAPERGSGGGGGVPVETAEEPVSPRAEPEPAEPQRSSRNGGGKRKREAARRDEESADAPEERV